MPSKVARNQVPNVLNAVAGATVQCIIGRRVAAQRRTGASCSQNSGWYAPTENSLGRMNMPFPGRKSRRPGSRCHQWRGDAIRGRCHNTRTRPVGNAGRLTWQARVWCQASANDHAGVPGHVNSLVFDDDGLFQCNMLVLPTDDIPRAACALT